MRQAMAYRTRSAMTPPLVLPEVRRRALGHSASASEAVAARALQSTLEPFLPHYRREVQRLERQLDAQMQPLRAATDTAIATLISQHSRSLQAALQTSTCQQVLDAERSRLRELTERVNPCIGLLTANSVDQEISRISKHLTAPTLPSPSLYTFGDDHLHDDQDHLGRDGVVIHAIPASQAARPEDPDRLQRLSSRLLTVSGRNLFGPSGAEEHSFGQSDQLLRHLEAFLASDEVGADPKEGIAGLIAWMKCKGGPSIDAEGLELNRLILRFLRGEPQLYTPSESRLSNRPRPDCSRASMTPPPELGEESLSSNQLAKKLKYDDSTLRKNASEALEQGPLPQPLKNAPDWFVVEVPGSAGGRGRGWKFKERIA